MSDYTGTEALTLFKMMSTITLGHVLYGRPAAASFSIAQCPSAWASDRSTSISLLFELHTMLEQRVDEGARRTHVRPFALPQFVAQSDERLTLDAR